MRLRSRLALWGWFAMLSGSACDGDGVPPPSQAGKVVPLIVVDWSLPAGTEAYHCARLTPTEDLFVAELRPVIPFGTHHTIVTADLPGAPDRVYECDPSEGGGLRSVYATGVGTEAFALPDGIAMKIAAGEQLVLNLHLYNTGDAALSGASGLEARLADPSSVRYVADSTLVGRGNGEARPGVSTVTWECSGAAEVTIFAVNPHMHRLGVHARATIVPADGEPIVLLDRPYSFDEQLIVPLEREVTLKPVDTLRIECTFDNPTGATVPFGESTDQEMCLLGVYRYPAGVGLFCS